jgi:hypothetical protein
MLWAMLSALALALVLAAPPVEVIRGHTKKPAAGATVPVKQEAAGTTDARAVQLDARQKELDAKEQALTAKQQQAQAKDAEKEAEKDAEKQAEKDKTDKAKEKQQKSIEDHGKKIRQEFNNATDALGGE